MRKEGKMGISSLVFVGDGFGFEKKKENEREKNEKKVASTQ